MMVLSQLESSGALMSPADQGALRSMHTHILGVG